MGKRGVVGVAPTRSVLKRPVALYTLAALECIGDINTFRDRVRDLGVAVKYRNASGEWVHRHGATLN